MESEQTDERLILITNPGSSSRKYALYRGDKVLVSLHFEYDNGKIICGLDSENKRTDIPVELDDLKDSINIVDDILIDNGFLHDQSDVDAIVVRVVAPGDYFMQDHLVDEEFMEKLDAAKENAPLHAPSAAREISYFKEEFKDTKVIAVSDSSFHNTRPRLMHYYSFDTKLADEYGIKRYGYHGLSVGSIVHYMQEQEILGDKTIICHIGSGSSVSAVYRGESTDNSMGYSPLEGVMMATRSGSMDVAAALAIKRHLKLSDQELESYLNKESGLLGMTGESDMREVLRLRDEDDETASFASSLYIHRIQIAIGQMAAELNGVDTLVFTATVGERNSEIRSAIMKKLSYLGFVEDIEKNQTNVKSGHELISKDDSKAVYVVKTDESSQMVRQANQVLDKLDA